MLDDNFPTFQSKQCTQNPLKSAIYFSQNGSEPAPEYLFERAHPSIHPAASHKYAVALRDPYAKDVVYAEVVVAPNWQQSTLSAVELLAAHQQPIQPTPLIPDTFTIQLYDPDQSVLVRYLPGSLTKTDSWEFEMLSQSFKMPTPSQIDRVDDESSPRADFRPRIMFKWKRDSRLSKDMTCYNVGKSLGNHKSKDPDITVALFKMGRGCSITVYEPNLKRVAMEDLKGLDIVLVIGSEVIRDLYLAPEKRPDLFNMGSTASIGMANGKRKHSKPAPPPTAGPIILSGDMARPSFQTARPSTQNAQSLPQNGPAVSWALGISPPVASSTANMPTSATPGRHPTVSTLDAETERLRKMVEEEHRRAAAERERRDHEEVKRIERMLHDEEQANRRRQAGIDKETERLRKLYGIQGQQLQSPSILHRPAEHQKQNSSSTLPSRQQYPRLAGRRGAPQQLHGAPPPPRPCSAGSGLAGPWGSSTLGSLFSRPPPMPQPSPMLPALAPAAMPTNGGRPSHEKGGSSYMSGANPVAAVNTFFQNVLDPSKKSMIKKKRSMLW